MSFPILGMSQGCAISVAFAVQHPERVSHLVLYGGFARGAYRRAKNEQELQKAKALATLIRTGWGEETPVFRQLFSSLFMPGATPRNSFKNLPNYNARRPQQICLSLFRAAHEEPGCERFAGQGYRADACHAQAR